MCAQFKLKRKTFSAIQKKRAVIELSSSSVKLLVGPAGKARGLGDFTTDYVSVRMTDGKRGNSIDPTWFGQNVLPVVMKYEKECDMADIHDIVIYCTGIYRLCENRGILFSRINEETGLSPIVITGKEEAELAPLGFVRTTDNYPGWRLFIDQGRETTEFTLQDPQGNVKDLTSIYLGNEMLGKAVNPQALVNSTLSMNFELKRILKKAAGIRDLSIIGSGGIFTKNYKFNHLDRIPVSNLKQSGDPLLSMYVGVCSALDQDTLVISKADSMIGAWFKYFEK